MISPLVEQLWHGPLGAGRLQVDEVRPFSSVPRPPGSGWREVERYYVVPSTERPTMLLPSGPAPALRGALTNYRGLRTARRQLQRRALGVTASSGRLPFAQVVLSVGAEEPATSTISPLAELSTALGGRALRAAIGVRTGANRKATLQLVDLSGTPVGFAKFAWSGPTETAVSREAAALSGGSELGDCRRPGVLATGTYHGWSYLVSAPLPASVRAVRGRVASPSPQELHDLAPVTGRRPLAESDQVRQLTVRLEALLPHAVTRAVVSRALNLLESVGALGHEVAMSRWWHGDLTPWNTARDADGRLWVWDWESCEPDAPAGLDALHWQLGLAQEAGRAWDAAALAAAVDAATPVLVALGQSPRAVPSLVATYVAALVERAASLHAAEGTWEEEWLTATHLDDLLTAAERRLLRP